MISHKLGYIAPLFFSTLCITLNLIAIYFLTGKESLLDTLPFDVANSLKLYALAYFKNVRIFTNHSEKGYERAKSQLETYIRTEDGEKSMLILSNKMYDLIKKMVQSAAICAHYENIGFFDRAETYRVSMNIYYKAIADSGEVSEPLADSMQWMAWHVVWEFMNKKEEYRHNRIHTDLVDYYFSRMRGSYYSLTAPPLNSLPSDIEDDLKEYAKITCWHTLQKLLIYDSSFFNFTFRDEAIIQILSDSTFDSVEEIWVNAVKLHLTITPDIRWKQLVENLKAIDFDNLPRNIEFVTHYEEVIENLRLAVSDTSYEQLIENLFQDIVKSGKVSLAVANKIKWIGLNTAKDAVSNVHVIHLKLQLKPRIGIRTN